LGYGIKGKNNEDEKQDSDENKNPDNAFRTFAAQGKLLPMDFRA
jgi:hypothetical protein